MEPLTLLAGAGLLTAGWLAGHVAGRRAERRRLDKPQEPICGCTHHRSEHDPATGECRVQDLIDRSDYTPGVGTRQWEEYVDCPCHQYVGPEPISSLWVPPVARTND